MKNVISAIVILALFLNVITEVQSQSCVNCSNAVSSGTDATAIGIDAVASGMYSLALGQGTKASNLRSIAIGTMANSSGMSAFAFGNLVSSAAPNAISMGLGLNNNILLNNVANSFMLGFNSNLPTLFVGQADGQNTTGKVGIGTSSPSEKLTVNGVIQSLTGGIKFPDGTVQTSKSPWLKNSNNIIYPEGNVGIGTSPMGKLDVFGDIVLGLPGENFILHSRPWVGDALIIAPQNGNTGWDWGKCLALKDNGQVYIGTELNASSQNANYKLAVNGKIVSKEVVVTAQNWADDVFLPGYALPELQHLEKYLKANHHLPEVPSECEVTENGVNVGQMNVILLKKVEELTLYVIRQEKMINELRAKAGM